MEEHDFLKRGQNCLPSFGIANEMTISRAIQMPLGMAFLFRLQRIHYHQMKQRAHKMHDGTPTNQNIPSILCQGIGKEIHFEIIIW